MAINEKRILISYFINIIICALGISSIIIESLKTFLFEKNYYGKFYDLFRFFTIDGNIYVIIASIILIRYQLIYLLDNNPNNNLFNNFIYFLGLSSSVSEFIIFIVVNILFTPFYGPKFINSFTGTSLHIIIPLLVIFRFLFLDFRIKEIKFLFKFSGFIPMIIYGIIISILILFKIIKDDKIPYSFLDYYNNNILINFLTILLLPSLGLFFSFLFDYFNKKFETVIFHDIERNINTKNEITISQPINSINAI